VSASVSSVMVEKFDNCWEIRFLAKQGAGGLKTWQKRGSHTIPILVRAKFLFVDDKKHRVRNK
jgi:hypothetical protein